jgi:Holliday junction resolvase
MGKKERDKGKRGERLLASEFRQYGFDGKRGQQYCGADGSMDVVGLPHIHCECKFVERLSIHDAVKQAVSDAKGDNIPAVFHKRSRGEFLVTLRLSDFMTIYREFYSGRVLDGQAEISGD